MSALRSTTATATGLSAGGVASEVFAAIPAGRSDRFGVAIASTLALHLVAAAWALTAEPSLEHWSAELALSVHAELNREVLVEPPKPPPPAKKNTPPKPPPAKPTPAAPAPPAPPKAEAKAKPAAKRAPPPRQGRHLRASPPPKAHRPAKAAPPAAAGRVLTQPGVVDLSGGGFVQGDADAYVGGVTTADGTGTKPGERGPRALREPTPEPTATRPKSAPPRDRSRAVGLAAGEWRCPWPDAADAAEIDEQSVIVRVLVTPRGAVKRVRVRRDPGFGFGAAAAACAREAKMLSALNAKGEPIEAWSPPIRVRFSR